MAGRAGRAGIDSSGESILIVKETDKKRVIMGVGWGSSFDTPQGNYIVSTLVFISQVVHLFSGQCDSCNSSLSYDDGKGLRALMLTVVGLKVCMCVCVCV